MKNLEFFCSFFEHNIMRCCQKQTNHSKIHIGLSQSHLIPFTSIIVSVTVNNITFMNDHEQVLYFSSINNPRSFLMANIGNRNSVRQNKLFLLLQSVSRLYMTYGTRARGYENKLDEIMILIYKLLSAASISDILRDWC